MHNLTITDVREIAGDSAFLVDDGKTAILVDSGFGFTGDAVTARIQKVLGTRPLDYIFITHSHYDHVYGVPYVLHAYPDACVVAGEYAAKIFAKDSAKALMRELDRKFAKTCGVGDYIDRIDGLRVDMAVSDGDEIVAGDMRFVAVALPGHTKCSMGFYLPENRFLISTETIGLYDGEDVLSPCFLVGYQMALDSIAKARALGVDNVLLPHFGLIDREKTAYYLNESTTITLETVEKIVEILRAGGTEEDAFAYFKERFFRGKIVEAYPIDAMRLNTSIMMHVIARELLGPEG